MTNIPDGTIMERDEKTGALIPLRGYTRVERFVRWLGRMTHNTDFATWNERKPVGFAMRGRVVVKSFVGATAEGFYMVYEHSEHVG